jgi:hypothetical protein
MVESLESHPRQKIPKIMKCALARELAFPSDRAYTACNGTR